MACSLILFDMYSCFSESNLLFMRPMKSSLKAKYPSFFLGTICYFSIYYLKSRVVTAI